MSLQKASEISCWKPPQIATTQTNIFSRPLKISLLSVSVPIYVQIEIHSCLYLVFRDTEESTPASSCECAAFVQKGDRCCCASSSRPTMHV